MAKIYRERRKVAHCAAINIFVPGSGNTGHAVLYLLIIKSTALDLIITHCHNQYIIEWLYLRNMWI